MTEPRLEIVPVTLAEANAFVKKHHRHHRPTVGHKFSVACSLAGEVVGVAITGRPVSRMLDDGWTLEVLRCCTDGTKNSISKLYSACWKVTSALGYKRLITYTLPEEGGVSLRASNFRLVGVVGGGSWSCKSRPRVDKHPLQMKLRWEIGGDR